MNNTQKETDWTAYWRQVERQKPEMIKAMTDLARRLGIDADDVWTDDNDDFSVSFLVERPKPWVEDTEDYENRLDVRFSIWDSGDADDGIYGKHGNFILDIVEEGGAIVGGFSPENYTERVWVDYTDNAEWDHRRRFVTMGFGGVAALIEKWLEEKI